MKVALYIGNHANDSLITRAGWALTRAGQKGDFWRVTHVEAIHDEATDGTVTIASASLREGGVRTKSGVVLTPGNWLIANVPQWDVARSIEWFAKHDGELYDIRGAFASAWPLQWSQPGHWFCNQAVADEFLKSAGSFGPAMFAATVMSFGSDVTKEFFGARYASI